MSVVPSLPRNPVGVKENAVSKLLPTATAGFLRPIERVALPIGRNDIRFFIISHYYFAFLTLFLFIPPGLYLADYALDGQR